MTRSEAVRSLVISSSQVIKKLRVERRFLHLHIHCPLRPVTDKRSGSAAVHRRGGTGGVRHHPHNDLPSRDKTAQHETPDARRWSKAARALVNACSQLASAWQN